MTGKMVSFSRGSDKHILCFEATDMLLEYVDNPPALSGFPLVTSFNSQVITSFCCDFLSKLLSA